MFNGEALQLEPVVATLGDSAVNLELKMTNAALGYEYAIDALDQVNKLTPQCEQIQMEIECYKKEYFSARNELGTLDGGRVIELEKQLRVLKINLFTKQQYLH